VEGSGALGLAVGLALAGVVLFALSLAGQGGEVAIVVPPASTVMTATVGPAVTGTPEAGSRAGPVEGRVGALAAPGGAQAFPSVQSVIEHYFGPLGAVEVERALLVASCETGGTFDPALVGAEGEVGVFQLHPGGAGARFEALGWNLADVRENVVAAALVVASDGWGAWGGCY
jgi:hypothetical protein